MEKTWHILAQEFAKAGHSVTHVSRQYPSLSNKETESGVRHIRVLGYNAPHNSLWLKVLDLLYSRRAVRVLPAADILVTHTFWLPLLATDARQGRIYVHVARGPKGQMRFYRRAARLQGISCAVADAIRNEVPWWKHRVTSIPLPLPWQVEEPCGAKMNVVLYVGRIHPEKGLHLLIQAFALLQPLSDSWTLRIVGPAEVNYGGGGEDYLRELQQKAMELGILVEWRGAVSGETLLRKEYGRAAIFVYPSLAERGETFGLAPLEAMSGGCATIVSSLDCFREFLRPGDNGLVFDHRLQESVVSLAVQLRALMVNREFRARLGVNGLETTRNFSTERVANLYLRDFKLLLESSSNDQIKAIK